MKLSSALIMASMASTAAASKSISAKNAAKVLRTARRLDNQQEEDEFAYIAKYNIKMIGCKADEVVVNPENGEYQYGAAVFRLCPTENGCNSDSTKGCSEGYGDYVVGLSTFVDAYFEDQRDNLQWDDNFQVDRYAQCAEYKVEVEGDDNPYENYAFYIGPTCTEDAKDVRLAVFEDETCTTASQFSYETLSQGYSLPFEDGGMVSTYCLDCLEYNDNGEYVLRDLCMNLYEQSASACEAKMSYYSYYGQNTNGCEYIAELMPASKKSSSGGKVFGWIVFIVVVAGAAGYVAWWRKKKNSSSDGLVA